MKPAIEKIEIVFQSNGKRKKMLVSWLLSQSADWAMDANPFIVQDAKLAEKIEGVEFGGRPVKPQLIAKYHYLKTVLDETVEDLRVDNTTEDETEASEHQVEETLSSDIDELKGILESKGIKYDKRKKSIEYFQELVKNN
jgi:hypothetical protein